MEAWVGAHWLSLVVFLPLGVGVLLLATGRLLPAWIWQGGGVLGSLATFILALPLWSRYDAVEGGYQFIERTPWIAWAGVHYFVGVDGISLVLLLMTLFLVPVVLLASWNLKGAPPRAFVFLVLMLETCAVGAFASLNLFVFVAFCELALLPAGLLVGLRGGASRIMAATRFMLMTATGSAVLWVALLVLGRLSAEQSGGVVSFDWVSLPGAPGLSLLDVLVPRADPEHWWRSQSALFTAFFFAYAIRIPCVPLHAWLPPAQSAASPAAAALLLGVVVKLGVYGLLRFAIPLFPHALEEASGLLFTLLALGMLHAAVVAAAQVHLGRLVAYLSVVQLGLITLGVVTFNPQGLSGAVLQLVSHSVSVAALLLLLGFFEERRQTLQVEALGGVARPMPLYGFGLGLVMLSLIGLPPLSGFAGEFLILLGAFPLSPWSVVAAATALAGGAAVALRVFGRVLLGPVEHPENRGLIDLGWRERWVLLWLLIPVVGLGVAPDPLLRRVEPAAIQVLRQVEARAAATEAVEGLVSVSEPIPTQAVAAPREVAE